MEGKLYLCLRNLDGQMSLPSGPRTCSSERQSLLQRAWPPSLVLSSNSEEGSSQLAPATRSPSNSLSLEGKIAAGRNPRGDGPPSTLPGVNPWDHPADREQRLLPYCARGTPLTHTLTHFPVVSSFLSPCLTHTPNPKNKEQNEHSPNHEK